MDRDLLAKLGYLHETYMESTDLDQASKAKEELDTHVKRLYAVESPEFRAQMKFEAYRAHLVHNEILPYLSSRQTTYPSVQPERRQGH